MTNLEILVQTIGSTAEIDESQLRAALFLADIDPDAEYVPANRCAIYGTAVSQIARDRGIKRVSEGDFTKEYASTDAGTAILQLVRDSKCSDLIDEYMPGKPKLINISNRA